MATKSNAAADVTRPSLSFTRRLKAPPAKVYAAWTDPQKIIRWFGRSDAKPNSFHAEIDARIGGRFRVSFSTAEEYYEVDGVYREVVPNEKLVFSWAWHSTPERQSQVTVALKPDGDGTLLTLLHEQLFDQAARDGHERGWIGALDKLENYLA
ncbi:MAG: SRPBCC domain-containing protein [Alphaproteobacteria bacterium]|nr:MAG: SRPBCC domain-containing protein [Alphaproteobacteria bacterium]